MSVLVIAAAFVVILPNLDMLQNFSLRVMMEAWLMKQRHQVKASWRRHSLLNFPSSGGAAAAASLRLPSLPPSLLTHSLPSLSLTPDACHKHLPSPSPSLHRSSILFRAPSLPFFLFTAISLTLFSPVSSAALPYNISTSVFLIVSLFISVTIPLFLIFSPGISLTISFPHNFIHHLSLLFPHHIIHNLFLSVPHRHLFPPSLPHHLSHPHPLPCLSPSQSLASSFPPPASLPSYATSKHKPFPSCSLDHLSCASACVLGDETVWGGWNSS